MTARSECPVCGSASLVRFLVRHGVPVHQNLILDTAQDAIHGARGDLTMAACNGCGFLFNQTFDPALLSYGSSYDNTQDCSPTFRNHVEERIRHLIVERGVRDCQVVEVGCGKGSFLRRLVLAEGANIRGWGMDPSYEGPPEDLDGRLRFERRFYGPEDAELAADVILCRHVIEHVPEPVGFLRDIRRALVNSPQARLFFETPCSEWILEHNVVWDFFYEHCSLFSSAALASAFATAGFEVQGIRHVFGGQYLWLEASVSDADLRPANAPASVVENALKFANEERHLREVWREQIITLVREGKVALWGAGAKGVTFANLIDPERVLLDCLVDVNPNKQGRFVPGTGHPIVDFHALPARGVRAAILMNTNYRDEIAGLLDRERIPLHLVG